MTELRPLLQSSDDELERSLLRSARTELPQALGLHETALALGLAIPTAKALAATLSAASSLGASSSTALGSAVTGSAATGGASGVVGTAGAVSVGALSKSLLGGALVSFLALTTYDHTLGSQRAQPLPPVAISATEAERQPSRAGVPAALVSPAASPPALEAAAAEARQFVAGAPRAAAPSVELAPAEETRVRVSAPANAAFAADAREQASPKPVSASASLAAEIRLLDQARAALAAGDSVRASSVLDAYESSRHSPTLAQEAALLRVQLLLTRGQRPAAAALARRIIAEHPESAHADSLRSLATEP